MGQAKLRKLAGTYPAPCDAKQRVANATVDIRLQAFEVADKGDLTMLKMLVSTPAAANWKHPDNSLVLLDKAVYRKNLDMVRFLLEQGANPNSLASLSDEQVPWPTEVDDGFYFSPLATAITEGESEIVIALLAAGADLNLPMWVHGEDRNTCRDKLNESPEILAFIESLNLEQATGEATRQFPTRRI